MTTSLVTSHILSPLSPTVNRCAIISGTRPPVLHTVTFCILLDTLTSRAELDVHSRPSSLWDGGGCSVPLQRHVQNVEPPKNVTLRTFLLNENVPRYQTDNAYRCPELSTGRRRTPCVPIRSNHVMSCHDVS